MIFFRKPVSTFRDHALVLRRVLAAPRHPPRPRIAGDAALEIWRAYKEAGLDRQCDEAAIARWCNHMAVAAAAAHKAVKAPFPGGGSAKIAACPGYPVAGCRQPPIA